MNSTDGPGRYGVVIAVVRGGGGTGTKVGGPVVRRPVAWVVAVVLLAEAVGVALVNWILGELVDRQNMSLADLDPGAMSASAKGAGVVIGLYLALCAVVALRAALRDRGPGRPGRALLISAAVVHGFVAALALALVSVQAFVVMVVVLGLVVLLLMTYDRDGGVGGNGDASGGGADDGGADDGGYGYGVEGAGPAPLMPPSAPTSP